MACGRCGEKPGCPCLTLRDGKALLKELVERGLAAYDAADPVSDFYAAASRASFEEHLRERMSQVAMVLNLEFEFALERAQYKPRRPGMSRLVGNARCNECGTFKPALTTFDTDPNGSCGWMVCDDCLRGVLPTSEDQWKARAEKVEATLERLCNAVIEDRDSAEVLRSAEEAVEDGEYVENMEEIADRNLNSMKELKDALANAQSLIASLKV